jgi:branched-chain amino acid transport system substrate-binding protein
VAGVPVLTFSNDSSVGGDGVFVLGFTPQAQILRLVAHARAKGLRRFAALAPANAYGEVAVVSFREAIMASGGTMTQVEMFDPAAGDLTASVRRLASYDVRRQSLEAERQILQGRTDEIARQALARLEERETLGDVGFDAILLPMLPSRLVQVAPLLAYYDVDPRRVKFLGTVLWESPQTNVEPSLAGGWYAAPPPAARADFVSRYARIYGRQPPRLATLAYDATALAAVLAAGTEERPVPDFGRAALLNPDGFAGTDGIFRLRPDGAVERGYSVLEVHRQGGFTVDPSPDRFSAAPN